MKNKNVKYNRTDYKYFLFIVPAGIAVEYLRVNYDIPLTILDILLFPLFLFIIIYFFKTAFKTKKTVNNSNPMDSEPAYKVILFLFVFIFMVFLGIWAALTGGLSPLEYFSGVKGAVHGYTMLLTGIVICSFGAAGIFKSVQQIIKRMNRS